MYLYRTAIRLFKLLGPALLVLVAGCRTYKATETLYENGRPVTRELSICVMLSDTTIGELTADLGGGRTITLNNATWEEKLTDVALEAIKMAGSKPVLP